MDRRDFLTVASATAAGSATLGAADAAAAATPRNARPTARERSRVWRIGTPPSIGNLQLTTRETPLPQRGEVLVRVVATSINARDRGIVAGFFPIGANKASIPLSEGAGEVIAVGEGVSEVAVGDRVTACHFPDWTEGRWRPSVYERDIGNTLDGWLGERVILPAQGLVRLPDAVSYESAATLASSGVTGHANALSSPGWLANRFSTSASTARVIASGGVMIGARSFSA